MMRYWDGQAWTAHTTPASAPAVNYAPQQSFHSTGPMTSAGMNVRREVVYNRQQTGHSLTLWVLLSLFLIVPVVGLIYYSVSPNHYWHA
jgi:hypothetical protein